ncbi:phosphotransferase [Catellatospora tritici]|uniref:phosphotransferase n=1 Tax=Catellatospora tritici TaxID=2851566 RepID=UPI001C2CDCE8|nr:phosphotransferase [Catellatospora tritici]MBV1850848.1 aminoglycoside phosphotransferase family protein [Catellatospora tritici]MBV1851101.1 aminoglycoside phosphotransferase family protein [Catellatospora tritici]
MPDTVVPDWDAALSWIDTALAAGGRHRTGPVAQTRVRPWSLLARVPVDGTELWFKANGPCSTYEAALMAALARWAPGRVLEPIAVEPERGWSLLPDGGTTLRRAAPDDPGHWAPMLTRHAELQRDLTGHTGRMLALGVPDMRPERLPGHLAALLDDPLVRATMPAARLAALRARQPLFAEACARLGDSPVPASVQHDDLYDGNVLVGDGWRFFDWGDASVGHPFGVLLVALRVAADRYGLPPGDPVLRRLRDAYLQPWTGHADPARLRQDVTSALAGAKVSRAVSWRRSLDGVDDAALAEYGGEVADWLGLLLEPDLV